MGSRRAKRAPRFYLVSSLQFLVSRGGVAQLGEHLLCKQGVIGSIPFTSTNLETSRWRLETGTHRLLLESHWALETWD